MQRFWHMIRPIFLRVAPRHIIEIGSASGRHARKILNEYCVPNGARLTVIDPLPQYDVSSWKARYKEHLSVKQSLSLKELPRINKYDAVLIDGDHNWYTVYSELKLIEQKMITNKIKPLIMLHDTDWPYARRDMYYNPESIPVSYRHKYARRGMIPGQSALAKGSKNNFLNNALYEGGPRNGVLTAVEDFIRQSRFKFIVHHFKENNGFTVIIPVGHPHAQFVSSLLKNFRSGKSKNRPNLNRESQKNRQALNFDRSANKHLRMRLKRNLWKLN